MAKRQGIALVGGESLLGADVRDVFREKLADHRIRLVGSEQEAILTQEGGEPVVMTGLDGDTLSEAEVIVLAGLPESTAKALEMLGETLDAGDARPAIIDLSNSLESDPPAVYSVPHAAAIALGTFLRHLHSQIPVTRAVAQIFEPASERGRAGIDEMQTQTTQLLTFKGLEKAVFDEQATFNLLVRYGAEAKADLAAIEQRIGRQLADFLAASPQVPMPSSRLTHASVMHGCAISLWVEFPEAPLPATLVSAMKREHAAIDYRGPGLDPPTPVGMAGQDSIAVGAVEIDRNNPRAAWFWIVADNFRLRALNAATVAEAILEG